MAERQKYIKKQTSFITAVQLDLDTDGFNYVKWGDEQRCKRGDWLVNNNGETYTIDRESFARTYREISPGVYCKSTPVWAEIAESDGVIRTKEGATHYKAGDYIVYNNEDGSDGYALSPEKFLSLYGPNP